MREDIITLGGPGRPSRGDADESIEALFEEHYPRTVYTALSLAGKWDLAEQLGRQAFLSLWRRPRMLADPEVASLYLQRTVVTLSRGSVWRRFALHGADPVPVAELWLGIAALPVRTRECVVLRCLIGVSETAAADLLGVSTRTVSSQTHNGLRQLRESLDATDLIGGSEAEAGAGGPEPGGVVSGGAASGGAASGDEPGNVGPGESAPGQNVAKAQSAREMTDADFGRLLRKLWLADMPATLARRGIDLTMAWRELRARRTRSMARRRRVVIAAAIAVVIGGVFAFPALTSRPQSYPAKPRPEVPAAVPIALHSYPGAVAAKMPLSGVTSVVGDGPYGWLVRAIVPPPGLRTHYQMAGIDLSTNKIMFRTNLGARQPAIAAGSGRLWLTTSDGQAGGQIARLDLTTGKVLSRIHLRAGVCTQLAFGSGHLFAACRDARSTGTEFWRISPATQQPIRLTSPVRGVVSSLVAARGTLWYLVNDWQIRGLTNVDGNPHPLSVRDPNYYQTIPGGQGLVYGDGSVWALSGGERLARIDASTGRVVRRFSYRNYDPRRAGGLDFLTAGGGWLWFLDNGYPFSGVLRVSEATGRPAGGVSIAPASCGQVICSQIFYTPGSVWVPTAELLIRIDTSRLPR